MHVEPEKQPKRPRGTGSVYRQRDGANWWVAYSDRGVKHRESSGSTDYKVAEKLLKRRLAEIETKVFIPRANVRIDELIEDVKSDYKEKRRKSLDSVEQRWRLHLKPFFTKRKAADVTSDMIRRYIALRTDQSAEPSTINRELSVLKHAYHLGEQLSPPKVMRTPFIPMFAEKNVRTGFLSDQDHAKLARECAAKGLWLRAILSIGYNYGWRLGEILPIRVDQIDLADRTVRLEVGTTKNGHGRVVKMTEEVATLLQACAINKKPSDPLFTHEDGSPVKDFRGAWHGVCVRAGLGKFVCRKCGREQMTTHKCKTCKNRRWRYDGLLFHDLRRSGVRNLRRLGVAESVAMKISGHKTASVFRRYDIVEMADLADAAARLDAKQKSNVSAENRFGHTSGIIAVNRTEAGATADSKVIEAVLPN